MDKTLLLLAALLAPLASLRLRWATGRPPECAGGVRAFSPNNMCLSGPIY